MRHQSITSTAWFSRALALCAALAGTVGFGGHPARGATLVRGPYLQAATPTNVVARWRTDDPSDSRVRFGLDAGNLLWEVVDAVQTTEHQLTLTNLAPGTAYFYAVGSAAGDLAGGDDSFVSARVGAGAGPVRIWAIGDSGTTSAGSQAPARVREAYRDFSGGRRTDVWLMLGDNAYFSGTDSEYQTCVFNIYADLLRTTPVWPTLGNHETYAPDAGGGLTYFSIFTLPEDGRAGGVPSGTERYYSFDHANIHFVCLDSELSDRSANGAMATWLEQDLAASTQDWIIAYWHSPPYSRGSHDSDFEANLVQMRESVVPVLESYGVDLVLCGHSHSYERSFLLNGHYGNSGSLAPSMILDGGSGRTDETGAYLKSEGEGARGTVYVVAGNAGQTGGGSLNHPAMYLSLNRLGSVVIDVESNRLEASFLRDTGVVEDRFSLYKGPVAPTIITGPRGATVFAGDAVRLSAVAHGTPPLFFQWLLEGQPLPEATNAVVELASITADQAGAYSVVVSNLFGKVESASANVAVRTDAPNCLPHPSGLVAWWAAEGNALDAVGTNHGQLMNGAGFAPGRIGQGFRLDGVNDFVLVPDSPSLDLSGEFSLELWFKADAWNAGQGLLDKRTTGDCNYGSFLSTQYGIQLYYGDRTIPGSYRFLQAGPLPALDVFHHFVGTFRQIDSGHVEMNTFLDGALLKSGVFDGNLANTINGAPIAIGSERGGVADFFNGIIDEVAIYNRALSADEVVNAFRNGSSGDCQLGVAPQIVMNPMSQTLREGDVAVLNVTASGSPVLTYQWRFEGDDIAGATSPTLTLPNIQSAQSGNYSVSVSNEFGSVVSAEARLTVLTNSPNCLPHPSGLVSWWAAEGNARDEVGLNHGQLMNGARFGPGKVGQGFLLDGVDDFVLVPDSPSLDLTNELSLEMWFKATAWGAGQGLLDKRTFSDCNYGVFFSTQFGVQVYYADPNTGYQFLQSSPLPSVGVFHHFVATLRQVDANHVEMKAFIDGVAANSGVFNGSLARAANAAPIAIGSERAGAADFFKGVIDEVAIYNRALQSGEVLANFNAGSSGLCAPGLPPLVVTNPASITVTQGSAASFSVSVVGSTPLTFQWFVGPTPIPDATNAVLDFGEVRLDQAGDYQVVVTNDFGSVTSSVARLVVVLPPSILRVMEIVAPSGGSAVLPVALVGRGTENALGFSLQFDPHALRFAAIELAEGLPEGTVLLANTNELASGRLGVAVAQAADGVFAAATQQLVRVSFEIALFPSALVTDVSFGDQPTVRQVSDPLAHPTPALYLSGAIQIAAAEFEGDLAPRPGGDRSLSVIDWVQAGRFAAGLDSVAENEFQRADCAPLVTKGNGVISVADWVQAGRYAASLDAPASAGGPSAPLPPGAGGGWAFAFASTRRLAVSSVTAAPGADVNVPVTLLAEGGENAVGLSVGYDAGRVQFLGALKSPATAAGLLNVNSNQANSGRVGLALAMPAGRAMPTGAVEVLTLQFRTHSDDSGSVTLAIVNSPVVPEVVDLAASSLATEFVGGAILLEGSGQTGPRLSVTLSGGVVVLSWPSSTVTYDLYSSADFHGASWTPVSVKPVEIGGQMIVPLTVGEDRRFFRLLKP